MEITPPSTCKVLIVEDEPGVRRGLCIRLATEPGLEVVAAAADAWSALDLVRRLRPDLVLMDGRLPDVDGFAATALLRGEQPDLPIIVLSLYDDAASRERAYEAGASAFVSKHDGDHALLTAIRTCSREQVDERSR